MCTRPHARVHAHARIAARPQAQARTGAHRREFNGVYYNKESRRGVIKMSSKIKLKFPLYVFQRHDYVNARKVVLLAIAFKRPSVGRDMECWWKAVTQTIAHDGDARANPVSNDLRDACRA